MTHWLIEPFQADMVRRALVAGVLAACLCSLVGCWVLLRGNVFLGEAMTHGMLPGVAVAALLGISLMVGGLIATLLIALGVAAIGRSSKLSSDTGIGLLLVGMLALGVIVVSRSQTFAVDLTGFLFGDVFAVRTTDLVVLAAALIATFVAVVVGHRAFVAVTFDPRTAATLGLRPRVAIPVLTVLMAVAMMASFHVVGTLLVLGLLIAPPAAALLWAGSIPRVMLLSAVIGTLAVYAGLLISWYAGAAGGATIAAAAVLLFFASSLLSVMRGKWRQVSAVTASACVAAACGGGAAPAQQAEQSTSQGSDVVIDGAREIDSAATRLVLVDAGTGATSVYDAVDETEMPIGSFGPVAAMAGDGRFAYLQAGGRTTVVDAGAWTFDHGDHDHYFATTPSHVATLDVPAVEVTASNSISALRIPTGTTELLDRDALGQKTAKAPAGLTLGPDVAAAVPYGSRVVAVSTAGGLQVIDETGTQDLAGKCPSPTWAMATRRAVVFGCAGGAVRITGGGGGDLTATPAPVPAGAPEQRPVRMEHRARADVFAGLSAGTVWVLDSRQRAWTLVPVPDAVATNTAGDGTVLVLHRDGTLGSYDVQRRTETARIQLFSSMIRTDHAQPVIEIDSDRAYVNNAGSREVYEIDYADGLRLARTLRTEVTPGLMVEAGR